MRKQAIYKIINFSFIIAALFFIDYRTLAGTSIDVTTAIILVILFCCTHLLKFARMYIILLEDLINPKRALKIYIKTTFISTVLPYKTGEIFKAYSYSYETKNAPKGIIAVFIEKVCDAICLCFLATLFLAKEQTTIFNPIFVIIAAFLVLISFAYWSFGGLYTYLNKFLVKRGGGRKSLAILRALERSKTIYDESKKIIHGRFPLLLFLTMLSWATEGLLLASLAKDTFSVKTIVEYLSDGFFAIQNQFFSHYTYLCVLIFLPTVVTIYAYKYISFLIKHMKGTKHE